MLDLSEAQEEERRATTSGEREATTATGVLAGTSAEARALVSAGRARSNGAAPKQEAEEKLEQVRARTPPRPLAALAQPSPSPRRLHDARRCTMALRYSALLALAPPSPSLALAALSSRA